MEFLTLSQRSGRLLKEWIFVQLMASAQHSAGDSALLYGKSSEEAELLFSSRARPAIRLEQAEATARWSEADKQHRAVHLPWFPFAISAPALSLLVDGLILLSAVLLCIDLYGNGRRCPSVALRIGDGNRSPGGVRCFVPVSVFILDGRHARQLARGTHRGMRSAPSSSR